MKVGLLITCYNRPHYLMECLRTVLDADLSGVSCIYIHDDASTETAVRNVINDFVQKVNTKSISYFSDQNKGIKHALIHSCNTLFYGTGCTEVVNLDGDAIVKKSFVNTLVTLKKIFPDRIVSGFNCNHPKNPILFDNANYVERRHANGINLMFSKKQYETIVKPALMSESGNWDFDSTHSLPFVIAKPSVVQHIGWNNSTMGHKDGDRACDY